MKTLEHSPHILDLEDFRDDAPIFNWDAFRDYPAQSWRADKLTAQEVAKCWVFGLCAFIGGMIFLITAFCL